MKLGIFWSKNVHHPLEQVFVGAVFCGEVTYQAGKDKYEIACGGAVGGSITVQQPYNYLTLCEVEAFGESTDEEPLINVALGASTNCNLSNARLSNGSEGVNRKLILVTWMLQMQVPHL